MIADLRILVLCGCVAGYLPASCLDDEKATIEEANDLLGSRGRVVQELMAIVRDREAGSEPEQELAAEAMRLLGRLRANEATRLLVERVAFVEPKSGGTPSLPGSWRAVLPAAAALSEIGSPVIEPLLDQVETTDDLNIRVSTSVVLKSILGVDLAIAAIELRIRSVDDEPRKQRLILLRDRLDRVERKSTLD